MSLNKLTIAGARDALRKGEVTSVEITEACIAAIDGADALKGLAAQPADLVVLDIKMPRLDGMEIQFEPVAVHSILPPGHGNVCPKIVLKGAEPSRRPQPTQLEGFI